MNLKMTGLISVFLFVSPLTILATTGTESTDTSVNDSSDSTAATNKSGQILSYLTAGVLATESAQHFSACSSHNKGQCVLGAIKAGMAALSMAQAAAHSSTTSGATTSATETDGYSYAAADTASSTDSAYSSSAYTEASTGIAKLESCVSGSCLNTKTGTITTADGKTYSVSDFASASAMAEAGVPSGAISGFGDYKDSLANKVSAKMEKLKIGALSTTHGFDEGRGGGTKTRDVGANDGSSASAAAAKANIDVLKKEPVDMAGLSKNYNGEPIGVSGQDIFAMVSRRYKLKENQDSFHTNLNP